MLSVRAWRTALVEACQGMALQAYRAMELRTMALGYALAYQDTALG